jgi:hypothetical protein
VDPRISFQKAQANIDDYDFQEKLVKNGRNGESALVHTAITGVDN